MDPHSFNSPVFILISDLRYETDIPERVRIISRQSWYNTKRFSRDLLTERITEKQYFIKKEQIEWQQFRKSYDKKIQEKYNVGPGWENNRWFMEQVRPTLL